MTGHNPDINSRGAELGQAPLEVDSPAQRITAFERAVQPPLPNSGQILGVLVKRMGIRGSGLSTKTAKRYFKGQRVKDSSKESVLIGAAKAFEELGLFPKLSIISEGDVSIRLAESALQWNAAMWDSIRGHLRPRMARVQPSHFGLVWTAYLRLAAIDLALRVAAALHVSGAAPETLRILDWVDRTKRGQFLNQLRTTAGLSLDQLAEQIDVAENTVDAWMYHGVRPSDQNLVALAKALSVDGDLPAQVSMLAELRRLYWASALIELLEENLDSQVIKNLLERLRTYAELAYALIEGTELGQVRPKATIDLAFLGSNAPVGRDLLDRLAAYEPDEEWREDLIAVSGNWTPRVLIAIYRIDQEEVAAIDHATGGKLLKSWDVSSPKAYQHYQKSMELQEEGRIGEALHEVAKAIALDPLDPVPHFTMGSMMGGTGNVYQDPELVKQGLEECRIAASLDPKWILPWAEIGYILTGAGRPRDAVEHLLSVPKDCGPFNDRYYMALALAYQALGDYPESLAAFEQALGLDPENLTIVIGAGVAAVLNGDKNKAALHLKEAQHLGAPDLTREYLQETAKSVFELVRRPRSSLL